MWLFVVVAVLLGVASLFAGYGDGTLFTVGVGRWAALLFGVGIVAVALSILHALDSGRHGLGVLRPIVGSDKRFSTSLTQLGLWTVVAGTGFAFLLGRTMFEGATLDDALPAQTWDEYLILLGGPFAAAVLAKGIVTYKLSAGTLQKSEPTSTSPTQVVTNDGGTTDLVDAQYLIFNLITIGYFVVQLAATATLPDIPDPLLALTSATASVFVANKAAQRNAPYITSVSPRTAGPGDKVIILGSNFDPSDHRDRSRRISVSVSGLTESVYSTDTSDGHIRFIVPTAAQPGDQTVVVTSTAGVETAPHELQIRSRDATSQQDTARWACGPAPTPSSSGTISGPTASTYAAPSTAHPHPEPPARREPA